MIVPIAGNITIINIVQITIRAISSTSSTKRKEKRNANSIITTFFAPVPVAVVGMQQEYTREQKVIELCTQKFNTPQEIQQCKAVLMKIER